MKTEEPILNAHNKLEYEPAHTCEHILNATMVKMFGCPRSRNAHVEKKKSKCDYILETEPTPEQVAEIENKVNEVIQEIICRLFVWLYAVLQVTETTFSGHFLV
jgi:alanyl-tRNA synthetase